MATAKKANPAAAATAPAKKKAAAAGAAAAKATPRAAAPDAAAPSKKRATPAAAAPPSAAPTKTKKQRTAPAQEQQQQQKQDASAAAKKQSKKKGGSSSSSSSSSRSSSSKKSASSDVRAALLAARHLRPPQRAEAAAKAALALPGVDRARAERACASLIRFAGDKAEREAASALPMGDDVADEALQLLVALRRAPGADGGKRKDKPVQLDVPHPMWTLNNNRGSGGGAGASSSPATAPPAAQICLFVRDDAKGSGHKAAKLRLSKIEGGCGVAKVVGTSKLRGKYESHEAKRKLCAAYDLFLADDRVLPSLPKLLGKQFFKRRKQPIPVRLSGGPGKGWRDLPAAVKRAAASAHLFPPRGTTVTVRCARVAHGAAGAADNVLAALAGVVARVPRGWANVSAVYVKTSDSVALPLYQSAAPAPGEEEATRAEAKKTLLEAKKKGREARAAGKKGAAVAVGGQGGSGGDSGDDSE